MKTVLTVAAIAAAWYLLSRHVLPRLGLRT